MWGEGLRSLALFDLDLPALHCLPPGWLFSSRRGPGSRIGPDGSTLLSAHPNGQFRARFAFGYDNIAY